MSSQQTTATTTEAANAAAPSDSISQRIQLAEQKVAELYELRDTYFRADKAARLGQLVDEVVRELLPPVPLPSGADNSHQFDDQLVFDHDRVKLSMKQKATVYYLRGKALDVFEQRSDEAEFCLQKAVNLNPKLLDAWNAFGQCNWKKNDLHTAKTCYDRAIALQPNKVSLRELSKVLRQIEQPSRVYASMLQKIEEQRSGAAAAVAAAASPAPGAASAVAATNLAKPTQPPVASASAVATDGSAQDGSTDADDGSGNGSGNGGPLTMGDVRAAVNASRQRQLKLVHESVDKARAALAMDMKDGESWYVLGNAYLSFFTNNTADMGDMKKSLQAYTQAEQVQPAVASLNPDLQFNKSSVLKFLQQYQQAFDGFVRAAELDASLKPACARNMDEILQVLGKAQQLIDKKGSLSAGKLKKQLAKLQQQAASVVATSKFRSVSLAELRQLQESAAAGYSSASSSAVLHLRISRLATPAIVAPTTFVAFDRDGTFCALSIYNIVDKAVADDDLVSIVAPKLDDVQFQAAGAAAARFSFCNISAPDTKHVLVNGKSLSADKIATPQMHVRMW